jgi:hypothetical protein
MYIHMQDINIDNNNNNNNNKVKNTPMEAQGREEVYSSYSFTTSTLEGVSG